jgi:DNA polymerase/3'-5' exonuclease PolX
MQRQRALFIAQELIEYLWPHCSRIEIAGSLRRQKAEVKDIELVVIPKPSVSITQRDMFGEIVGTTEKVGLHDAVEMLINDSDLAAWSRDVAVPRWGDRYKRLLHTPSGIACDLFITDRRRWGYQHVIRTGPAEFSKAIVTLAMRRRMHFSDSLLHGHARHKGKDCPRGERCTYIVPTESEQELFTALRLPVWQPDKRSPEMLWKVVRKDMLQ